LPCDQVALKPFDMVGLDALHQLFSEKNPPLDACDRRPVHLAAANLSGLVDEIAADGHGLVMLMGKGGVGKTTMAAAVAAELAHRGLPVLLTTSDPAAHLIDTLHGALANLTVSRIDPRRTRVTASVDGDQGAAGRPGARALEDAFPMYRGDRGVPAFSRAIARPQKFVVMDTAPTGHTLLLLDATGAYHRDIARQMIGTGLHYVTPMMQLQDPKRTKVLLVTLAETTPVLEAAGLQADLRRAGIEPWAWIINNSVAAAQPHSPLLLQRARNELREIDAVATRHARRHAVVPLLREDPVGVDRLRELAGHIAREDTSFENRFACSQ
jgi:arsenite-transporting ATPase